MFRHFIIYFITFTLLVALSACGGDPNAQSVSSDDASSSPAGEESPSLMGVVTDTTGAPLAEARVAVTSESVPVPEILALTNEAGEYAWTLAPGTFTVTVYLDGYAEASQDATIEANQVTRLDFQLQPAP